MRSIDPDGLQVCVSLLVATSEPRYASDAFGDILVTMPNTVNIPGVKEEVTRVMAAAATLVDMALDVCAERAATTREDITFELRARLRQLE